jgi:beta-xylosidase
METKMWNADLGNGMYKNPILYADYSDPDACRVGEDYFMIASSFCNAPGLPILHSKDLVNWKVVNYIYSKLPDKRYDKPVHGCGVWAPAIRYHEGTYFACVPMSDEGIYMSTTKDPFGAWSEPVNIRPGAGWIDPCPFWDDDGKAYLVAGVAKSRIGYKSVLHMVEMQPDGMGLIGEEKVVFDGNLNDQETIEGPKLYKRNGWYYIFAPAGGVKPGWQTVLRSRNIFGPYEYRVVMRQGDTLVNGPHQGAWVDTVTGEDWFLHFQDVYAAGRIIHLQPMSWKEDWPIIGVAKDGNEYGEPVLTYRKPNVGEAAKEVMLCEPDASDDFTGKTLGLQWQWNANPLENWCEFTGNGLRLNAVCEENGVPYGDYPNLLLQKWPAPEFTCETTLSLAGLQSGAEAGVISMGVEYALITFKRADDGSVLASFVKGVQKYGKILVDHTEETSTPLGTVDFADDAETVTVRMRVHRVGTQDLSEKEKNFPLEEVEFSYSTDGANYQKAGSYMAVPGRWVGVKSGVFCAAHDVQDTQEAGSCMVMKCVYA